MADRIAAIFAHPDDEVLGAGATLARCGDAGDEVRILILATGLTARGDASAAEVERLRDQGRRAAELLGAAEIQFADFPDNRMDTVPLLEVVDRIAAFVGQQLPATVFTHHGGDLNIDHRVVHQAVVTACRPLPHAPHHEILACEVNSSTEWAPRPFAPFEPTVFIDAAATISRKVAALSLYESEVRTWPHPRSPEAVRALASWRGAQCGMGAAEAFALIRQVRR